MNKIYYQRRWNLLTTLILILLGPPSAADFPPVLNGQTMPSLAPMLDKVLPAVVNISSAQTQTMNNPLFNDPFFRYFFNIPERSERKNQSRGSGVVIDASKGYVITNNHVIDNANEITVTLKDGREFKAQVVGTDPETDVTLIKIPAGGLSELPLANSDELRVGDFVVAIGNPFGLGQTVTSGIVSALGRTGLNIENYEDFIQTDASINPGNSGGALVNLRGELVGVNTAIIAPNGGNVGIGFAIPSNMVQQVVSHLVQFGKVQRGSLGVVLQELDPKLAAAFGLNSNIKGVVVTEVKDDSPAQHANLMPGDVITAINNQPVNRVSEVRNRIGLLRIGNEVSITVIRKGRLVNLSAILEGTKTMDGSEVSEYLEGAIIKNVVTEGVQITEVAKGSVAWRIGFRPNDIIIGLSRQRVKDLDELKRLLKSPGYPLEIKIQRNGENLTILLQ